MAWEGGSGERGGGGWGVTLESLGSAGSGVSGGGGGGLRMSPSQNDTSPGGWAAAVRRGEGEGEVLNVIINSDEQKLQAHLQVYLNPKP